MRFQHIALASLTASVALAGCGTLGDAQLTLTKSMLGAEGLFNAAAQAELDAKAGGFLIGDAAARADAVRHQAYVALQMAEAVYNTGRSPDLTNVMVLVRQLQTLTPKKAS